MDIGHWILLGVCALMFAVSAFKPQINATAERLKSVLNWRDVALGVVALVAGAALALHFISFTPGPDPEPEPPPIPVPSGFRVLFVRESSANMTAEQLHTWNSTQITAYLNDKCVKDGVVPSWRKLDKDQDLFVDGPLKQLWADSKAQAIATMPSVVIAVNNKATVYPMGSEADMLKLLKSFGG